MENTYTDASGQQVGTGVFVKRRIDVNLVDERNEWYRVTEGSGRTIWINAKSEARANSEVKFPTCPLLERSANIDLGACFCPLMRQVLEEGRRLQMLACQPTIRLRCCAILGLQTGNVNYDSIKQQMKPRLMDCHPDRNGLVWQLHEGPVLLPILHSGPRAPTADEAKELGNHSAVLVNTTVEVLKNRCAMFGERFQIPNPDIPISYRKSLQAKKVSSGLEGRSAVVEKIAVGAVSASSAAPMQVEAETTKDVTMAESSEDRGITSTVPQTDEEEEAAPELQLVDPTSTDAPVPKIKRTKDDSAPAEEKEADKK